jgi:hypothetical protein
VLCWFWVHSYLRKTWRSLLLCQSQHSWIDRLLVWLSSSTIVVCLVLYLNSNVVWLSDTLMCQREIRLRILVTSLLMDTISIRYGFSPTDERIKCQLLQSLGGWGLAEQSLFTSAICCLYVGWCQANEWHRSGVLQVHYFLVKAYSWCGKWTLTFDVCWWWTVHE